VANSVGSTIQFLIDIYSYKIIIAMKQLLLFFLLLPTLLLGQTSSWRSGATAAPQQRSSINIPSNREYSQPNRNYETSRWRNESQQRVYPNTPYYRNRDIWVGGTYNLWSVQSVAGLFGDYEEQEVTVTAINGNGQITFAPAVAVQALAVVSGIVLIPTLDYLNRPNCVYNIQQSNLVLYKMMTAGNSLQKQVFSTYKYEARQMLDGVKFDETFLLEQPTYNVYLMTPLPNKIMSNADGIDKYRFYVNDQALTDRDIDVNDSSLHVDNLIMSFTNSQDRLLNLNPDKYKYSSADNQVPMTDQEYKPLLFPSKIYQRSIGGAPNFTGMGGLSRQLRCTLQTDDGAGCDTKKLAYLYKEHFMAI